MKFCYSPLGFQFPDELQHWRSATNVIDTGHLYATNHGLPISPQFPGLENATAALASLSGLSVFAAGMIVVAVAHVLVMASLFLLFRAMRLPARVAGLATLLYGLNPHAAYFDAIFGYQTFALPFLVLALLVAAELSNKRRGAPRSGWIVLGVICVAVVVTSHHVTSIALIGLSLIVGVIGFCVREWRRKSLWPLGLAGLTAGLSVLWVVGIANDTLSYLRPAFTSLIEGLDNHGSHAAAVVSPLTERIPTLAAAGVISLCIPAAWWLGWRLGWRYLWPWAFLLMSGTYYTTVAVRFLAGEGVELSGRALTFVFIPVSVSLALVVVWAVSHPRHGLMWLAGAVVGGMTLLVGGLAGGWPPFWERLPGPYQVAGFERSVEPQGIASANWTRDELSPGNRFGADFANYTLLGSYGAQDVVRNAGPVFYADTFGAEEAGLMESGSISYLLVDDRLASDLPASGRYFPLDPLAGDHRTPLAMGPLTKFDAVPGADRIYDGGHIVIYDMRGALGAS